MKAPLSPERFESQAAEALNDTQLQDALQKATGLFAEKRGAAVDACEEWDSLREHARLIKEHTLLHLDEYLENFAAQAEASGVQVHWARDGEEACRVIEDIARNANATRLVKSKSMTTEEIHLNKALQVAEIDPVETDLGEWIIQLAGETPSHIIAPAIHKSKEQIADLFVEKLAIEPTTEVEELAATARKSLRRHFAEADLGVSGVNFAVAETGSILILENEGNARMTTTLPKIHIALMGVEKVIPRFADLAVFLRLLPRSGTGQKITTYQSILTGNPRPSDEEGPNQIHVVILDNGRTGMLAKAVTRQALNCIRCGACLNVCPVYQQVGGHAYGSVYPGPIGAVITPQLTGIEKTSRLPFASSLCGACRDACPVGIDIPELLLHLRAEIISRQSRLSARIAFRMWAWAMVKPWRYSLSTNLARAFPFLLPVGRWKVNRSFPGLAPNSFRKWWKDSS
ncbi:MAG TPA: iron-sulfur cluster-binding protein [Planctomycetes bacterium]|nr:iron-sulfur cluster-binding protein [Planctomycetota bacterium]|tara:strand:+ start:1995 stop:3368 length:1374 start_codon:yes stop_codon:yes gene_type:complete